MTSTLYLIVMLGIIILVTLLSVPSLFRKACPDCGTKNWLEAKTCKKCGKTFAEIDQ